MFFFLNMSDSFALLLSRRFLFAVKNVELQEIPTKPPHLWVISNSLSTSSIFVRSTDLLLPKTDPFQISVRGALSLMFKTSKHKRGSSICTLLTESYRFLASQTTATGILATHSSEFLGLIPCSWRISCITVHVSLFHKLNFVVCVCAFLNFFHSSKSVAVQRFWLHRPDQEKKQKHHPHEHPTDQPVDLH